jgi:hypothetical protein
LPDASEPDAAFGLTVTVAGRGSGQVISIPSGIACPPDCSIQLLPGSSLTLYAVLVDGSESYFRGWSGGCTGPARMCAAAGGYGATVTADFEPQDHNIFFVTDTTTTGELGQTVYDSLCNNAASGAGLNNHDGNAYLAWMASSPYAPTGRFTGVRGFVRPDGTPFADSFPGVPNDAVLNPPVLDEYGQEVLEVAFTGTSADGTASGNDCGGWQRTDLMATVGSSSSGPGEFLESALRRCDNPAHIYCARHTFTTPLLPKPSAGKLVFLSSRRWTPGRGIGDADAFCDGLKPASHALANFKALLATSTSPASSRVQLAATYVREDGQVVGTGAELAHSLALGTGIWQDADGHYPAHYVYVWTGSQAPGVVGTMASTCGDWNATTGNGQMGDALDTQGWWAEGTQPCTLDLWLYCIEQ